MPSLDFNQLDEFGADILEWVAMYSLQGNLHDHSGYLSSYETPKPNVLCKNVRLIEITGFFTRKQLQKMYTVVRYESKIIIIFKGNRPPFFL